MKALAKPKQMKRFADGGEVTEGANSNIGDDVRSRALAWAAKGGDGESSDSPAGKTAEESSAPVVRKRIGTKPVSTAQADRADRLSRSDPAPAKSIYDSSRDRFSAENVVKMLRPSGGSTEGKGRIATPTSKTMLNTPSKYASGGLVKRAVAKSHGKAC